jgi:hypothetical protein
MLIGIVKDLKFKTQMSMNYERYQRESLQNQTLDLIVEILQLEVKKTDNGWDRLPIN